MKWEHELAMGFSEKDGRVQRLWELLCETCCVSEASGSVCVWSEWGMHGASSDWGEE